MKQLIKQPFLWFSLYLIILLFPSILFSYNYDESSQNLFSYNYNDNPTVKVIFIDHAHNSKEPKLSFGVRIRPIGETFTYSQQSNIPPKWSNTSTQDFQEHFQDIKPAEIIENYELYPLAEFRAFIKTLFGYKKHILKKHGELFKRSGFTHFYAKLWSAVRSITSPSHVQNFIKKMHDELLQEEKQINQLHHLYSAYEDCQPSYVKHSQLVSQRMCALQQSLEKDLQHSFGKSNWSDVDPIFIHTFNLANSSFDLNGIPIQHVLQKEFHDIAQETAQAWIYHENNSYIQQLVEKNVTCIKSGIKQNQSGKIIEAARLADIGWVILDHVQAIGEGALQGAGNVAQAFFHPIDTVQSTAKGIAQCAYYLGQATLEAIDLSILAATDQSAAYKKLQTWKNNFTKLANTINEQWQTTSNRDITKFVSRFITEILVAHQAFRALHELFSIVRTNTVKLVQKTKKKTAIAKTSKGNMAVNEMAEHTQPVSKQTRKATKKNSR